MILKAPFSDEKPRAAIIGSEPYPPDGMFLEVLENTDFTICINCGSKKAKQLGIKPNEIIGDLDSLDQDTLNYFSKLDVPIVEMASQEENDLEKGIKFLLDKNYKRIVIFGCVGKRDDHTIATFQLVKKYRDRAEFLVLSNYSAIFILNEGNYEFEAISGQTVSLFPFPEAYEITTEGLYFPLQSEDLYIGARGLSNYATADRIRIDIKKGSLLVIKVFPD